MKVAERKWQYGNILYYEDVEPEWLEFSKDIRVLPAPFFYEKSSCRLFFVARYEPGEYKGLPEGGFHVRDTTGANRWYELDQVIIHPNEIQVRKLKIKLDKKTAKDDELKAKAQRKLERQQRVTSGKRGRPSLSTEEKAQRELDKQQRTERSGGKRGRPPKDPSTPRTPYVYVPRGDTGKKRGRPAMSEEDKKKRELEAQQRTVKSGGKRGRPSDPEKKALREREAALRLSLNPERRRGRPKRS